MAPSLCDAVRGEEESYEKYNRPAFSPCTIDGSCTAMLDSASNERDGPGREFDRQKL